jgi:glycosyltransferase involved in cell wall biosynthesis
MKKKVIVSVINDLATDQRVARTCNMLAEMNYDVLLIGRKLKNSLPYNPSTFRAKRMKLLFSKGFFFYAEYNFRLFFFLLFNKADLFFSNDLDTLLPNYVVAKLKSKKIIYDSHEIFCGVPELQKSKIKKSIWQRIEKKIFPKLKHVITVNESIANYFCAKYKVMPAVVRNIPDLNEKPIVTKAELKLPDDKKILILQGSGINIHRGAEELVEAMQYVENAILLIIGGGDVLDILKKSVADLKLSHKVIFYDKKPFNELIKYTSVADIGLTLDKDNNINYKFSLPNKIFDYINAGIAVLASSLVEVKKIVHDYKVGCIVDSHNPKKIAEKINFMIGDVKRLSEWKSNSITASKELNWQSEKEVLRFVIIQCMKRE